MSETTAPVAAPSADSRKKRSAWKPLAAAGIGGAVLVATGFGVFAQLSATATNTTPETVNSGDLKLVLGTESLAATTAAGAPVVASTGFTQAISNLAPGDSVNRFVTLTNAGSLDAANLQLKVTDTPTATQPTASILSTDPNHGLQIAVQNCTVAWTGTLASPNPATGAPTGNAAPTCTAAGGATMAVASTALANFGTAKAVTASTVAKAVNHLLVTVSLPDQNEVTVNGTPSPLPAVSGSPALAGATTSIQQLNAALTFTFTNTQRAAVASNS